MQKSWEEIQAEVTRRIHVEYMRQYEGKQRAFARAVGCDEKTIRKLFGEEMNMTLELYFKLCKALEIKPSSLLTDLAY